MILPCGKGENQDGGEHYESLGYAGGVGGLCVLLHAIGKS